MSVLYRCDRCDWHSESLGSPNITEGPIPEHKGCGGEMVPVGHCFALTRYTCNTVGCHERPAVVLYGGRAKCGTCGGLMTKVEG